MNSYVSARETLSKKIADAVNVIESITSQDHMILREDVLQKFGIDLTQFFPKIKNGEYELSNVAHEVKEGKFYDLNLDSYKIIPLTNIEERKTYNTQRYLVLYECDLLFTIFFNIRQLNAKLMSKDNGIWAYKNDSELNSGREMSNGMVQKLEAEKAKLLQEKEDLLGAFRMACVGADITHGVKEILLKELEPNPYL